MRRLGRAMPAAGGYGLRAQVRPGYSRSLGQVFNTCFFLFPERYLSMAFGGATPSQTGDGGGKTFKVI